MAGSGRSSLEPAEGESRPLLHVSPPQYPTYLCRSLVLRLILAADVRIW